MTKYLSKIEENLTFDEKILVYFLSQGYKVPKEIAMETTCEELNDIGILKIGDLLNLQNAISKKEENETNPFYTSVYIFNELKKKLEEASNG